MLPSLSDQVVNTFLRQEGDSYHLVKKLAFKGAVEALAMSPVST